MDKSQEPLPKRLRALMDAYGNMSEFCRETGLSRNAVEAWLAGASSPTVRNLEIAAAELGTTLSELLASPVREVPRIPPETLQKLADCTPTQRSAIESILDAYAAARRAQAGKKEQPG